MEIYQLGTVSWEQCCQLQRRLAYDAAARNDAKATVLLAEHPEVITVGQSGSRGDFRILQSELDRRNVAVHWISRDGGTVYHAPGQLAVYLILSLSQHGWTAGEYMRRFQNAMDSTLRSLGVKSRRSEISERHLSFSLYGRKGPLVIAGVQSDGDTVMHGAYLNVAPAFHTLKAICGVPRVGGGRGDSQSECTYNVNQSMTTLVAEVGRSAKMANVRSFLMPALAEAMGHDTFHPMFGHPWLRRAPEESCA